MVDRSLRCRSGILLDPSYGPWYIYTTMINIFVLYCSNKLRRVACNIVHVAQHTVNWHLFITVFSYVLSNNSITHHRYETNLTVINKYCTMIHMTRIASIAVTMQFSELAISNCKNYSPVIILIG